MNVCGEGVESVSLAMAGSCNHGCCSVQVNVMGCDPTNVGWSDGSMMNCCIVTRAKG